MDRGGRQDAPGVAEGEETKRSSPDDGASRKAKNKLENAEKRPAKGKKSAAGRGIRRNYMGVIPGREGAIAVTFLTVSTVRCLAAPIVLGAARRRLPLCLPRVWPLGHHCSSISFE